MIDIWPTDRRECFVSRALQLVDRPYLWGGDDPSGFDCSGLVVECAKSCGLLPRRCDYTAAALFMRWKDTHQVHGMGGILPGCLLFYYAQGQINHVEIALNSRYLIGASGGGSHVKTLADAIRFNAFIKIRPIDESLIYAVVDPFREE